MKKVFGLTLLLLGMASLSETQAKQIKPPKPVGGKPQESAAVVTAPDSGQTILLLATSLVALAALRRRLAR